ISHTLFRIVSSLLCVTIHSLLFFFFFFNAPPTTDIYTLSLHDALPISLLSVSLHLVSSGLKVCGVWLSCSKARESNAEFRTTERSEEHTSELQSRFDLVCRLLLEKKNNKALQKQSKLMSNASKNAICKE